MPSGSRYPVEVPDARVADAVTVACATFSCAAADTPETDNGGAELAPYSAAAARRRPDGR